MEVGKNIKKISKGTQLSSVLPSQVKIAATVGNREKQRVIRNRIIIREIHALNIKSKFARYIYKMRLMYTSGRLYDSWNGNSRGGYMMPGGVKAGAGKGWVEIKTN